MELDIPKLRKATQLYMGYLAVRAGRPYGLRDVARRLNVSHSTVFRLYNDKMISVKSLINILQFLGDPLEDYLKEY